MTSSPVVVKVGGSLFDWPELGPCLRSWLNGLDARAIVLVPGGGPTADVVRELDRVHGLGEEAAHWLALRALTLNAHFLAGLLPPGLAAVVEDPTVVRRDRGTRTAATAVLDGYGFARLDEGRPGSLPHSWSVTSDSVAARVAAVVGARRLILLKSVTFLAGISWQEAGERGLVDGYFATAVRDQPEGALPLDVTAVNLRGWRGGRPVGGP